MIYEIKFWREIRNGILHIGGGIVVTHMFLPYCPLWLILIILTTLGVIREWIQKVIQKKWQPLYIQVIDVITIDLGGIIWYWYIVTHNINVDTL